MLDGFRIKDIPELENFNFYYEIKGHVDLAFRKGKKVERKVRYIRLFNRKKINKKALPRRQHLM